MHIATSVTGVVRPRICGMDVATRIDQLVERSGLSNQAVADVLGVSDQTIARWRKGVGKKGPSLDQAILLARRLGTTVEYLATGRHPAPAELTEDEAYIVQIYRDLQIGRAEAVRRLMAPRALGDYPMDAQGESDEPPHRPTSRRA